MRERVLSDSEIRYLWSETTTGERIHVATGLALRLALITGRRASEVAYLRRQGEVDLPGKRWTLRAARSKNMRSHLLPIFDLAIETIEVSAPPITSSRPSRSRYCMRPPSPRPCLASSARARNSPTTHDLRRTFATRMSMLQVVPEVRERLLTQTLDRLVRTYEQWSYLRRCRIRSTCGPTP